MQKTGGKVFRPDFLKVYLFLYPVFLLIGVVGVLTDPTFKPLDYLWYALASAGLACLPALLIVLASPVTVTAGGIVTRPALFQSRLTRWDDMLRAKPVRFLWMRVAQLECAGLLAPVWLTLDMQGGSRFTEELVGQAPQGNPLRVLLETGESAERPAPEPARAEAQAPDDGAEETGNEPAVPVASQGSAASEDAIRARLVTEDRFKSGANWFFWIAALSVVNTVALLAGINWSFVVGLAATQFVDAVMMLLAQGLPPGAAFAVQAAGAFADLVIAGIFVLFGVFARKRHRWSFLAGMVLYGMDAVLSLVFGDYLSAGFHVLALFGVWSGYRACLRLRKQTLTNP